MSVSKRAKHQAKLKHRLKRVSTQAKKETKVNNGKIKNVQRAILTNTFKIMQSYALSHPLDTQGKELKDIEQREKHASDSNFTLCPKHNNLTVLIGMKVWIKSITEMFWLVEGACKQGDSEVMSVVDYTESARLLVTTYLEFASHGLGAVESKIEFEDIKVIRWLIPLNTDEKVLMANIAKF